MYSTNVYYYTPRQIVVYFSGNSARRYQLVYAKNLKLNKGVDNRLQFQFLNQEQKPVDITGKDIVFRLINYNGTEIILEKLLTLTLSLNGLCEVIVYPTELEDIDTQYCSYSLEMAENGYNYPVFVNSEAGARGTVEIVNSVLPSFMPAMDVTIPTHTIPNNSTETYYSSTINTIDNPLLTIQTYQQGYSGNVQVQGSTLGDSEWYNIGNSYPYLDNTGSEGYVVEGFHPFIRVKFVSTQGDVTQILAR